MTAQGQHFLTGDDVPEPHRQVVAGRDDAAAVGAERHAKYPGGVAAEDELLLTGGGIPEPHGAVAAGGRNTPAVGAERDVGDK